MDTHCEDKYPLVEQKKFHKFRPTANTFQFKSVTIPLNEQWPTYPPTLSIRRIHV